MKWKPLAIGSVALNVLLAAAVGVALMPRAPRQRDQHPDAYEYREVLAGGGKWTVREERATGQCERFNPNFGWVSIGGRKVKTPPATPGITWDDAAFTPTTPTAPSSSKGDVFDRVAAEAQAEAVKHSAAAKER